MSHIRVSGFGILSAFMTNLKCLKAIDEEFNGGECAMNDIFGTRLMGNVCSKANVFVTNGFMT